MNPDRKTIEVVAAIIRDDEGRIFATQRGYGEWKDWWEFPGGPPDPLFDKVVDKFGKTRYLITEKIVSERTWNAVYLVKIDLTIG